MEETILYTTHCPRCEILKLKLRDKGITYREVTSLNIMKEAGVYSIPQLCADGKRMTFTEAILWINRKAGEQA